MVSSATVLYDQTFNYYIADFFDLPPSVNGTVRAVTGLLAFITNSTLTMVIVRKTNLTKSLGSVFVTVSLLITLLISVDTPFIFILINCVYFAIHATYIPIIQSIVTTAASDQTTAVGILNSLRSLGMIFGAILAGSTYVLFKKAPFIIAIVLYISCGLYCVLALSKNDIKPKAEKLLKIQKN